MSNLIDIKDNTYWDVISVEAIENYKLKVKFYDDLEEIVVLARKGSLRYLHH